LQDAVKTFDQYPHFKGDMNDPGKTTPRECFRAFPSTGPHNPSPGDSLAATIFTAFPKKWNRDLKWRNVSGPLFFRRAPLEKPFLPFLPS
ncbi:MAG TPA: hypothetical protein VJ873_07890, partial [bacterium]|nr:hypothetical protein [bacterium]